MNKTFQLNIPRPCYENWDQMHPAQKGRFCDSCNKQVMDFSVMTDAEILNYFKHATGKICGRFDNSQLQRSLNATKIEKKKNWQWLVATILALMISTRKGYAQKKETKAVQITVNPESTMLGDTIVVEAKQSNKEVLTTKQRKPELLKANFICGKIVDENGMPIPYATVMLKDTKMGTSTDVDGNFKLQLRKYSERADITVSALGYQTVTRNVSLVVSKDTLKLNTQYEMLPEIVIHSNTKAMMGEVVTVGAVVVGCSKPAFTDTSLAAVRKALDNPVFTIIANPLKVFPNPIMRNGILNIELGITGEVQLQLLDVHGKLLVHEELPAVIKTQTIRMQLPSTLAPGIYFVKVTGIKQQKQYVEKISVQ